MENNELNAQSPFTPVDTYITSISQTNLPHAESYFIKTVNVGILESPTTHTLLLDNPAFYEILQILFNAYLSKEKVKIYRSGTKIQSVEGVQLSEVEKRQKAAAVCVYIFENEIEFTNVSWAMYTTLEHIKKVKFWKRWLRTRMRRLLFFGFDPYYMFHADVYKFWKQHEPEIDAYLKEFIHLINLDQQKVEENLGRQL